MNEIRAKSRYTALLTSLITVTLASIAYGDFDSIGNSNFEIDPDDANFIVDDANPPSDSIDWESSGITPKLDLPSGSNDDAFGQGSKEDTEVPSVVSGSIPPNKSDLESFGVYLENQGAERYLHLFWTRVQDPSGTTNLDFEFNQGDDFTNDGIAARTNLDMLIQYDLENGGTEPTLWLSRWIDGSTGETDNDCEAANKLPCWSTKVILGGDAAIGSINSSTIPAEDNPYGDSDLDPRTFGEASIDFAAITSDQDGGCFSFGSAYLKSRSSAVFNSSMKDFIAPQLTNVSNCAQITIRKVDDTGVLVTTSSIEFKVYEDNNPGDDFDILVDGKPTSDVDPTLTHNYSCTTGVTGMCTVSGVLPGDYWIVETAAPAGHVKADPVFKTVALGGGDVMVDIENIRRGNIVVTKQTLPDGDTATFSFTGAMTPTLSDGNSSIPFEVDAGSYAVTESVKTGWDLTSIVCDDSGSDTVSLVDVVTRTATFKVDPGETVECTFTNTKEGSIKIAKETLPDGDTQSFGFTGEIVTSLTDGNSSDAVAVVPGTYTVSETALAGWDLTGIDCVGDANSAGDIGNGTATFHIAAGENVTCTFTNTKEGSIKIAKETLPDGDTQSFGFTGEIVTSLTDGNSSDAVAVVPGTYTVSETALAGWDLTGIDCVGDANSSGDIGNGTATFRIAAGENVTCTFTNTKEGSIKIAKETLPDGDTQSFGFTGEIVTSLTDGNSSDAVAVVPGTYTVSETALAGWDLTGIVCDDPGSDTVSLVDVVTRTATFKVDPGETVECTFTNTKRGKIIVEKLATSYESTDTFGFTGDITATLGDKGKSTAVEVVPGTHTVTEDAANGWDLTGISCNDGNSTGDIGTRTATYIIAPGETVTCTFTNTPLTTIDVLVDSLVDGGTKSTIECKQGSTIVGSASLADDPALKLSNRKPGTYVCTIVVDGDGL